MIGRKRSLVLVPCSESKKGRFPLGVLPTKTVYDFIGPGASQLLSAGRECAFNRPGTSIERGSTPLPALARYTGYTYRIQGFKESILEVLASNDHCLVISGGYGLLRPEEPIHRYEAPIQKTAPCWRTRLSAILEDYIKRNGIGRMFVASSSPYASLVRSAALTQAEIYWYVPQLGRGHGNPRQEVPRLVGEAVVGLVAAGMRPDERWLPDAR